MTLTNKCNSELEHNIEDNRGLSGGYEVLVAVLIRSHVSWDMMLCRWVSGVQHFKGSHCLNPQEQAVHKYDKEHSFLLGLLNS